MFLKKVDPKLTKEQYIEKLDRVIGGNKLVENFLNATVKLTDAEIEKIAKAKSIELEYGKGGGMKGSSRKKMIDNQKKLLETVVLDIEKILNDVWEYGKGLKTGNTSTRKMNADTAKNFRDKIRKTMQALPRPKFAKAIGWNKELKTLDDFNNLVSKLKMYIAGVSFELVIANAIVESGEVIPGLSAKSIEEAFAGSMNNNNPIIEWTGLVGISSDKQPMYGTTDFIMNIGRMRIGVDVKSNKEMYIKSYQRNFLLYDSLDMVLNRGINSGQLKVVGNIARVSNLDLLKKVMYSITNYRAFVTGMETAIGGSESPEGLAEYISKPIQKIIMASVVVYFVDEYLANFKNNTRWQILIQLGDQTKFLSDFIDEIIELIGRVSLTDSEYSLLGYVNLTTTAQTKRPGSSGDFIDLWERKKRILSGMYAFGGKESHGTGAFYKYLYDNNQAMMGKITQNVMKTNYYIRLQLPFIKA